MQAAGWEKCVFFLVFCSSIVHPNKHGGIKVALFLDYMTFHLADSGANVPS